jgi:hypothetical protein
VNAYLPVLPGQYVVCHTEYGACYDVRRADQVAAKTIYTGGRYGGFRTPRADVLGAFETEIGAKALCDALAVVHTEFMTDVAVARATLLRALDTIDARRAEALQAVLARFGCLPPEET